MIERGKTWLEKGRMKIDMSLELINVKSKTNKWRVSFAILCFFFFFLFLFLVSKPHFICDSFRVPPPLLLFLLFHLYPCNPLAFCKYSLLGASYSRAKKRAEFRLSHRASLASSSRSRLTDCWSMFVWAMSSGMETEWRLGLVGNGEGKERNGGMGV